MVEFIRLDVALFSQRPATQRSRPADNIQTILHTVPQIMGSIHDPILTSPLFACTNQLAAKLATRLQRMVLPSEIIVSCKSPGWRTMVETSGLYCQSKRQACRVCL